jgi:AcrR family transcriptional regulator
MQGELMAQVKKVEVRAAILGAADALFSERGYNATTLAHIASEAGISTANLYVYFGSKLDILYSIYEPWLRERLIELDCDLKRMRSPQRRVRRLVHALWCEIPSAKNAFANNFIQAIATASAEEGYRPELLRWVETRITDMLHEALPPARRDVAQRAIARMLVMAFDGFVIARHLDPNRECDEATIELMVALLLGPSNGRATSGPVPVDERSSKR